MACRRTNRGIEENTLAILDASGDKDTQDNNDDRIAFLEAVRASSIVPGSGTPPTSKMYEAIFQIMKDGKSLELIMASYQLLNELEKHYPRVYLSCVSSPNSSCSTIPELVVVKEAWSPLVFGWDACSERESSNKDSGGLLDSYGFNLLIQKLAEVANEADFHVFDTKFLRNMLLFQYLVNVLEGDFLPRHSTYEESMNWTVLKESLLNMLLGLRRISYKGLVKDCLSVLCYLHGRFCQGLIYSEDSSRSFENCNSAVVNALLELGNCTSIAAQRLLVMIMELDMSKKKANMNGHTTRADSLRTPLIEIILDEITYNKDILFPFFLAFHEPKWKLEIVLQYFSKYIAKPAVRTRRSNDSKEDATLEGVLKCFSNINSAKSVVKKISSEVAQLLLAHAFQAYLMLLSKQQSVKSISDSKEVIEGCFSVEICKNMISAFNCLKNNDADLEILPLGKEAVFVAATILSTTS
ncbi:negative regulator of systemic acquired resistance SNI1 isoform X1 [Malania oleifera]|uniref:negative regulator of systemic acquired resistance SNI1 isoform X1 n=1 Tax=Malania oleifera TaxID=397392 RepID=UPI0025AE175A|nr:negative regulator of systemic acquired resistance SNI1 isoform X1 [Malania oleifera]